MVRKEPQLVFFTILTQISVGTLVVWGSGYVFLSHQSLSQEAGFIQTILSVVMLTLVLGVLAASLHLGRPWRSIYALRNISRSWLSREAFLGLVFGCLVLALILIYQIGSALRGFTAILTLLGILSGLCLILGISRLYRLRTVPAWNHPGTPATFFTTSLLLGAGVNLVVWIFCSKQGLVALDRTWDSHWMHFLSLTILFLVGLQLVIIFLTLVYLSAQGGKAGESVKLMWFELRCLLILRWVIAFAGAGLLYWQLGDIQILNSIRLFAVFLSLALILLSEIISRWIFYGSYQREGF